MSSNFMVDWILENGGVVCVGLGVVVARDS